MYEIPLEEVSDDFARCWKAAGLHIQNQAQGSSQIWLKANLMPPFLEHLSFRLGNQIFFVQIQDVEGALELPGNHGGLLTIAKECAGHACLMPMRRAGAHWKPAEPGWGLIDARTGAPINPVALISDEKIVMTDWELHDFAVEIVSRHLADTGKELIRWNGSPRLSPSIWFEGDQDAEWVVVQAVRYPEREAPLPDDLPTIQAYFAARGCPGHFASVAVSSADETYDPEAARKGMVVPLYRGYGMHVKYHGLKRL